MPNPFLLRHPTLKKLVENSTTNTPTRTVTIEELQQHDGRDDDGGSGGGWIALCGYVYDLEPFFDGRSKHPGGAKILSKYLGKDATSTFMQFHYPRGKAVKMAPGMLVGVLLEEETNGGLDDNDDDDENEDDKDQEDTILEEEEEEE